MPSSAAKKQRASSKAAGRSSRPALSSTPERFEQELRALAAKAKGDTSGSYAAVQASVYFKSAVLLGLMAVYSNVSQSTLSPVYGSIPSAIWHDKLVMAACFTGWSSNLVLGRRLPVKPYLLLPLIAIHVPVLQFFLFKCSGAFTARWGPLVTEAVTLFPLMTLSAACVATCLDEADFSRLPTWLADAAPGLGSYSFFKLTEKVSGGLMSSTTARSFLSTRLGREIGLAACYSLLAPSRILLYALPALLHTAFLNTHVPTPFATSALNTTLAAHSWTILDRRESLTGYISVLESVEHGFRVMRCDHSLLGGEWLRLPHRTQPIHSRVAEPIYGVFAMLEAVRLVEVPRPVPDGQARALNIGLGIGTTPAALVAHGIDTTVVEIDPVVHEFASTYFELPDNLTIVIEDAITYTERAANSTEPRFDYIIHDVFTGGAEPIPLFTLEFLKTLDALLKPDGVIAINYAGDFALPPPIIVVKTIRHVFPSCRIFREYPRNQKEFEKIRTDFTNMVIFCRKRSGPVTFRRPDARDVMNSQARQKYLLPKHEVLDADFIVGREEGILTRNETQRLDRWHEKSALDHWIIMRAVLPPVVWENW